MLCEHRIATGGIVIHDGKMYRDDGEDYLVASGGAIDASESLASAVEKEGIIEVGW
jgi:hypothetical protein